MKTDYSSQLNALLNSALNGIYEMIKGKEPFIFFSEVKNAIDQDQTELPEHFLNETLEIMYSPSGYYMNEYYYVYGIEDNGLCINVLCVDDALQIEKIELESLDAHQIVMLADFINEREIY